MQPSPEPRSVRSAFPFAALAALILLVLAAPPAAAQAVDRDPLGFRSWGLRAGAASDPDQAMIGIHVDLGELVPDLRLQPSLELGAGDADTVQLVVPVHYRFDVGGPFRPYAGGGLALSWIDYGNDPPHRRRDRHDFDIAPVAVGGVDVALASGHDLLVELQLGGGDAFDAKVMAGVTF